VTTAIDTGLGFYQQVMALRGYRQEVLSSDIANASTPGFKAVDLDFAQALKQATGGSPAADGPARVWLVDDPRQMQSAGGSGDAAGVAAAAVKYQVGTEVTLDGNSVDLDQEKTEAAANAVDYEAAATFASQSIKMLTIAINGSASQSSGGS